MYESPAKATPTSNATHGNPPLVVFAKTRGAWPAMARPSGVTRQHLRVFSPGALVHDLQRARELV
jgi:hypothetical protein